MQEILERLIFLQQFGNALNRDVRALVREVFEDIIGDLIRLDPTSVQPRYRRGRQVAFLSRATDKVGDWLPGFRRLVKDSLAVLGRQQAIVAEDSLIATLGTVDLNDQVRHTPITQARIRAILNTEPFQGRVLKGHVDKIGTNVVDRIGVQLRLGMAREEPIDDLVRRIRGRKHGRGFTGGVMGTTTREAEALVRTAVTFTANEGMLGTFRENADILAGVRYVATLDDRTCFVAGTEALTPDGYRPIESVRPGDVVVGGSGLPRRVEATRVASASDMARVTLSNGRVVECTADHLWLTDGQEWVEAAHLRPGVQLAQALDTSYLTGHEDVSSLRREVRSHAGEGEQILRDGVLPDRAETRRLHRHPRDEGAVRYVRGDARPDEIQEAGRESGGSSVLLSRVLSGAPHQKVHGGVRGLRAGNAPHAVLGEDPQVLLPGVPHSRQATRADQLPDVRNPVHADPDSRHRVCRVQGRPDAMLGRMLQPVGQRGRRAEAEDRRGVQGREPPQLERGSLVPQSRLPGTRVAPGSREGTQAGRRPLYGVRCDPGGERTGAVGAPHRAVPQLRVDTQSQPHDQPDDAVSPVPSGSRVAGGSGANAPAPPTVVRVERYLRQTTVYDIQVERDHSFIVAGAVVHNSLICFSLDGGVWELGDPDVVIPGRDTHHQCRSILVGVIDWAKLGLDAPPPADRIARDLSGLTDEQFDHAISTRRSRGEFGPVEKVSSNTLAKDWLRRQPKRVQDEIMGPRRAELFRKGEKTLKQMVTDDLRVVNLDELVG